MVTSNLLSISHKCGEYAWASKSTSSKEDTKWTLNLKEGYVVVSTTSIIKSREDIVFKHP